MNTNCIFCKIINKSVPGQLIKETNDIIVIKDINPKASIHYLIIPKKHFADLNVISPDDILLLGQILFTAKDLASEFYIPNFKLVVNNGKEAGQCVFHFHMHFLAEK